MGTREGPIGGDVEGGIWGDCCFQSWGLGAVATLLLPPGPGFGAQIQPVFILLPAGFILAGESCF